MPGGQTTFNGRRVTVTCNGSMIADFDWNSPQENMANAQLCASAPDLLAQRNALLEALQELRSYADLKLQGHRQDYPEDHCMVQTALRMIALADNAIALAQGGDK